MRKIRFEETDDSLMRRAASGDTAAFDVIVRRHQDRVQRFASRMLGGDPARGADIAVSAFLRLWERRHAYVPCGKIESWLLTTAYRQCLDQIASDPSHEAEIEEIVDPSATLTDRIEAAELQDAVRQAVSALPPIHRAVVVLTVYEGLSYEAAAETLGIPPGTVASRKSHALTMLRRRLAAWEELN